GTQSTPPSHFSTPHDASRGIDVPFSFPLCYASFHAVAASARALPRGPRLQASRGGFPRATPRPLAPARPRRGDLVSGICHLGIGASWPIGRDCMLSLGKQCEGTP